MGAIKSKLKRNKTKDNKYLGLHVSYRENYDKAFKVIGDKIHRIPLKHIVNELDKNKFKDEEILLVLIYLRQYAIDIEQKNYKTPALFMFRIQEIEFWIDSYQNKYWNSDINSITLNV